jgi:PAS domain S-box-containing protein
MAWVGFADCDNSRIVRPVACSGFEEGFLERTFVSWANAEHALDPTGTAIRTGEPCTLQNISSDAPFTSWREEATRRGYAAVCALPLMIGGRTIGALAFFSSEPHAFDAAEVALLSGLASDLGFSMTVSRARIEHKQSEEALRRSEEQFRRLAKNSNDIISIIDENGIHTSLSGALKKVTGYEPEELLGTSPFAWIHPGDLHTAEKSFAEIAQNPGCTGRLEYRFRHKNGNWVAVESIATNLLCDSSVKGIVLNTRDVSERNRLWEQLQQAMKMEAVGRLSEGIAHHFNNLLTAISGNVDLARMELGPSDALHSHLDEISKAAESAASLACQLFVLSRRQVIEPRVLNLNDLIENLKTMLERLTGEGIELRFVLSEDIGSVRIDHGQFGQMLADLAVNARDAMPDGGRLSIETRESSLDELYCRSHPETQPGKFVQLEVSDTGHGMSDEVKKHLFEPFFSTKSKGYSTGLGLATTFGIVRQAGGAIEVCSEIGKGTTFKISLPSIDKSPEELIYEQPVPHQARGSKTVLIVEDDSRLRNLTLMTLKMLGYNVLAAANGDEAFALAEKYGGQIDLLMTDLVTPAINGRGLAARLRQYQPRMRVLFTSGNVDAVTLCPSAVEGEFIEKPFSHQLLAKKIAEILGLGQEQ